jgi:hypothetical protein
MRRWTEAVLVGLWLAIPAGGALAATPDPLLVQVRRVRAFLERKESKGVTLDSRYALNPGEVTRLSVVPQLLGFNDLHAVAQAGDVVEDVRARADFLLAHLAEVRTGSTFDGMIAYALLDAYEITRDARYFAAGKTIAQDLSRVDSTLTLLNWGLMTGMGLAKYYDLTGDTTAYARTRWIVSNLAPYQAADGSFPHYCRGAADVHYTAWMGMELIHIRRYVPSPELDRVLDRIADFLEARVLPNGDTQYEGPCLDLPGSTCKYYGKGAGCWFDYDTRGWVNELAYTALVLAHRGRPRYSSVMSFLGRLEDHGAFDDKWEFIPAADDPSHPWTTGHPSIIRTSTVFWSLATLAHDRATGAPGARPGAGRARE